MDSFLARLLNSWHSQGAIHGVAQPHSIGGPSATTYASFLDRAIAKLIDLTLLGVCLLPLDVAFDTSFLNALHRTRVEGLVGFALFCLYSAALESSKQQATWGKRAVGLVTSDLVDNRISFARALVRSIMQYTAIGYVLAAFTSRRQTFHDLVAGTQVTPGTL